MSALPMKVILPVIAARMKESHDATRERIASGNVWAFTVVTEKTGKRQIERHRQAAVFKRQNVIDLKGQFVAFLRHPAVFATTRGTTPNQIFEALIHWWSSTFDGFGRFEGLAGL
jgi:steroid 5-alpha reductase family enzyme